MPTQLDCQLTWKMSINYLLNKVTMLCFVMGRLVPVLSIEILNIVYYVHLYSLIRFGILFWGNSSANIKCL